MKTVFMAVVVALIAALFLALFFIPTAAQPETASVPEYTVEKKYETEVQHVGMGANQPL
ncbi:hypothetical protein Q8A64_12165 [Oxalobacteraceae bacterium R-40]|uniref:Uncharacterized protein n=1 Tax=Keguizhuia sedimenti TaxID=3064264 RepID=A0ABU1BQM8_9BURK|nr:hypothetical protein [Oxalobacteraceae bacterium R-40]